MQKRRALIKTLSPLHIGSEETLSPVVDFVWNKGKVFILDKDKLIETLEQKGLDTIFFQAVHCQEKLSKFLKENKIDYRHLAIQTMPAPEEVKYEIKRFLRLAGKICLPGSSIKGAIRTAILFWGFKTNKKWQERLKKQYNNWKKAKNAFKETSLDKIFGINPHWDVFRNLAVSDNLKPIASDVLKIVNAKRIYKDGRQTGIKVSLEVIKENITVEHEIRLGCAREIVRNEFSFLSEANWGKLIEIINFWAKEMIEWEKKSIKDSNIKAFYNSLEKEISQKKSHEFFLRLGGYKTYFDQTLGFILKEILSDSEWERFVKRIAPKVPSKLNEFPNTIWICDNKVIGWVKVCVVC